MRIRTAPERFNKHGYRFSLVSREQNVAIYQQTTRKGKTIAYEVHLIRLTKPHPRDRGGWDMTELLASDESFGRYGWCCVSKDRALEVAQRLLNTPALAVAALG